MRFKIVRLTATCNELELAILASSGIELLQMVSELVTERCANKDADFQMR